MPLHRTYLPAHLPTYPARRAYAPSCPSFSARKNLPFATRPLRGGHSLPLLLSSILREKETQALTYSLFILLSSLCPAPHHAPGPGLAPPINPVWTSLASRSAPSRSCTAPIKLLVMCVAGGLGPSSGFGLGALARDGDLCFRVLLSRVLSLWCFVFVELVC